MDIYTSIYISIHLSIYLYVYSTLATSVVLYSLTGATLMSPKQDFCIVQIHLFLIKFDILP